MPLFSRAARMRRPSVSSAPRDARFARAALETLEGRQLFAFADITPTDDGYVRGGAFADDNFGSSIELLTRNQGTDNTRRGLLKFSLDQLGDFDAGKLRLHGHLEDPITSSVTVSVYAVSDLGWDEDTVTWNTQPAHDATNALAQQTITNVGAETARWYEFDVGGFVEQQKALGKTGVSFLLKAEGGYGAKVVFSSKEAASNRAALRTETFPAGASDDQPLADAFVRGGTSANEEYGGASTLAVKLDASESFDRDAYLKFAVGSAPVARAKLRVFGKLGSGTTPPVLSAFAVADTTWSESAINWTNRPAPSGAALSSVTVMDAVSRWYEFDVTTHAQGAQTAGAGALSLMLAGTTGTNRVDLNSKEAAVGRPQLVIVPVDAPVPQPPAAPSAFSATAASPTQIDLAWQDNATNETGFEVQRSADGVSGWTTIATAAANATAYAASGLSAATTYHFRVRAVNATGASAWVGPVQATTQSEPDSEPALLAPTGLTATADDADLRVALNWNDNPSTPSVAHYVVYRSTTGGFAGAVEVDTVTQSQATDDSVGPGTAYYYWVTAVGESGVESPPSGVAYATTVVPAPTGFTAAAVRDTEVNLAWTDTIATDPGEDGFTLEQSSDGGMTFAPAAAATIAPNATGYTVTGLKPETAYAFRLSATAGYYVSEPVTATATTGEPQGWEDLGGHPAHDIASENVQYFGGGQEYPAGTYRVAYESGAINFTGTDENAVPDPGWGTKGFAVELDGGAGPSVGGVYPGKRAAVEAASEGISTAFAHPGGTIGLRFSDSPYYDNGGGPVQWRLERSNTPIVSIAATDAEALRTGDVTERTATFTVTRTGGDQTQALQVQLHPQAGTVRPEELATAMPASVEIPANAASAAFDVVLKSGTFAAVSKSIVGYLAGSANYLIGALAAQAQAAPAAVEVERVEFFKSETTANADWQADAFKMPWESVYFRDMPVKLKVTLKQPINAVANLGHEVRIRAFSDKSAAANWKTIQLDANDVLSADRKEVRVTISGSEARRLGLLGVEAADNVEEFTSLDLVTTPDISNYNDSNFFDTASAAQPSQRRGKARTNLEQNGNVDASPPESPAHFDFMKSGGVVYLEAASGTVASSLRAIQDQADTLYVSGHGTHATGTLLGGGVNAASVRPYWNQDINKVFLAGCSVLDINDYNSNFEGADHNTSPGESWATTGPELLFGYNFSAPADVYPPNNNANYSKEIIEKYLNSSETDEVKKWMYANRDMALHNERDTRGGTVWNACVIDMRAGGVYWFWDFNRLNADGTPQLGSVPRAQW